ncbi:MAG: PAS domain-containing protein, partial [Enterobacterales bacterium]
MHSTNPWLDSSKNDLYLSLFSYALLMLKVLIHVQVEVGISMKAKIMSFFKSNNEAEQELRAKQDAINKVQAVIEFDMDGIIITANDNFCNAMGYTLDEIQGKHHSMFAEESLKGSPEYKQFWEKLNRGEFEAAE